nr:glycosyltransferase [Miltoncostaea oceani]
MSLSVCTLVRNRNALLRRVLEGLERSTVPPRELVVVRAGGEDPAPVLAAARRVRVVVEELPGDDEVIPYSAARNRAAAAATGSAVCFLDADAIPGPGLVAALDAALADEDAIAIGDILYLPPGAVGDDWTAGGLRALGRRHPGRPAPPAAGVAACDRHELVWGTCFAMRRDRFLELGGFHEGFQGYAGEDTDLAIRARAAGVPLRVVAGAEVLHQHHDVWDPPLQQFRATLANARVFRDRHGWWPMGGWLDGFARLGLIAWDGDDVRVLRDPTPGEIDAARRAGADAAAAMTPA